MGGEVGRQDGGAALLRASDDEGGKASNEEGRRVVGVGADAGASLFGEQGRRAGVGLRRWVVVCQQQAEDREQSQQPQRTSVTAKAAVHPELQSGQKPWAAGLRG